jgi:hypothetical protein
MNIYLIPYTWMRHLQMAFWCGMFCITAWWCHLMWFLNIGPFWAPSYDGFFWLCPLVGITSGGAILLEGNMRRAPLRWRIFKTLTATGASLGLFYFLFLIYDTTIGPLFFTIFGLIKPEAVKVDLSDAHKIVFQNQLGLFLVAGFCVSFGTLIVRKWKGIFNIGNHILGGLLAGMSAGAIWIFFLYFSPNTGLHLYLSGAFSSLGFGFVFGMSAWPIPDELYAGWLRVMSPSRFGHRVPIDATEGAKERFVGSYANGLDLYLPSNEGVMELHISAYVEQGQHYIIRGLSQQSTVIKRPLETVQLNYNPNSPQPSETQLYSEDLIYMGSFGVIEFIMLPREES